MESPETKSTSKPATAPRTRSAPSPRNLFPCDKISPTDLRSDFPVRSAVIPITASCISSTSSANEPVNPKSVDKSRRVFPVGGGPSYFTDESTSEAVDVMALGVAGTVNRSVQGAFVGSVSAAAVGVTELEGTGDGESVGSGAGVSLIILNKIINHVKLMRVRISEVVTPVGFLVKCVRFFVARGELAILSISTSISAT
jgi:hypothetical protein